MAACMNLVSYIRRLYTLRARNTLCAATPPKMENRWSSQIGPPEAVAVRTINIRRAHARYRNVNPFKRGEPL